MSQFKRASLMGSEELFRPTRPTVVRETDEVITEVLDRPPVAPNLRELSVSTDDLRMLIEALQEAKYPDKPRPKPSLEKFERLDDLRTRIQSALD